MINNVLPISVIIPHYNTEKIINGKYLIEIALDSIFNSEYIPNECIIVDDYSTDNSVKIIEKYMKNNNNIILLKNEKNIGALKSRQKAIKVSSNKYISLLDADDFLEDNALYKAYNKLIQEKASISLFQLYKTDENGNNIFHIIKLNEDINFNGFEATKLTLGKWKIHASGLYEKNLFLNAYNDFNYDHYSADELLTRIIFNNSKKVTVSNGKYFYRTNSSSITQKKSKYHLDDLISMLWLQDFSLKYGYNKDRITRVELLIKSTKSYYKILCDYKYYLSVVSKEDYLKYINDFEKIFFSSKYFKLTDLFSLKLSRRLIQTAIRRLLVRIKENI